jgi:hypothetical protein
MCDLEIYGARHRTRWRERHRDCDYDDERRGTRAQEGDSVQVVVKSTEVMIQKG